MKGSGMWSEAWNVTPVCYAPLLALHTLLTQALTPWLSLGPSAVLSATHQGGSALPVTVESCLSLFVHIISSSSLLFLSALCHALCRASRQMKPREQRRPNGVTREEKGQKSERTLVIGVGGTQKDMKRPRAWPGRATRSLRVLLRYKGQCWDEQTCSPTPPVGPALFLGCTFCPCGLTGRNNTEGFFWALLAAMRFLGCSN